jgi:hypothetical protein
MRHLLLTLPLLVLIVGCSGSDNANPQRSGLAGAAGLGESGGGEGPSTGGANVGGAGPAGSAAASGMASAAAGAGLGGSSGRGGMNAAGTGTGGAASGAGTGGTSSGTGGASGAGTSVLVYPPAAVAGDTALGIEQLNKFRATLGQSAVTLDAASSTGCLNHLLYLIEEAQKLNQTGYLTHDETDTANSHYSLANQTAGQQSDIAFGTSGGRNGTTYQTLAQAVDLWINGVYHRHPLLAPGLVKLGAASMSGYNCVNYAAPGNTINQKPPAPVLWPANGMTDVPRAFGGNEGPCPTNPTNPLAGGTCGGSGFIVSATFYNYSTNRMAALSSVSSVTLTDQTLGAPVSLLTWYADKVAGHDPAPGYMQDEIALVPQAQLAANTSFRVDISAVVNGAASNLSWTFTTGSRAN